MYVHCIIAPLQMDPNNKNSLIIITNIIIICYIIYITNCLILYCNGNCTTDF